MTAAGKVTAARTAEGMRIMVTHREAKTVGATEFPAYWDASSTKVKGAHPLTVTTVEFAVYGRVTGRQITGMLDNGETVVVTCGPSQTFWLANEARTVAKVVAKTLGEMAPEERKEVTARAVAAFQAELTESAPRIAAVLEALDVDAPEPRAAKSITIGQRGRVYTTEPDREGNGATRSWSRTINGTPYSFVMVTMPNGELRYSVQKYNGYMDRGTPGSRAIGMRFGCAWTRVHFITVKPTDVTAGQSTPEPTPEPTPELSLEPHAETRAALARLRRAVVLAKSASEADYAELQRIRTMLLNDFALIDAAGAVSVPLVDAICACGQPQSEPIHAERYMTRLSGHAFRPINHEPTESETSDTSERRGQQS